MVLINLPMTDVLTAMAAVKASTLTESAALAQVDAVGRAHVGKVKRLIAAGAQYIVVAGVYDMGKSPWAIARGTGVAVHQRVHQTQRCLQDRCGQSGQEPAVCGCGLPGQPQRTAAKPVAAMVCAK